jgi:hypothetical protein
VCSPQEGMVQKGIDKVAADVADSVIKIHVWLHQSEQLHQVCRRKTQRV